MISNYQLRTKVRKRVSIKVNRVLSETNMKVWNQVSIKVNAQVNNQVRKKVRDQVWRKIFPLIDDQIIESIKQ
jgi:hypothetical protein